MDLRRDGVDAGEIGRAQPAAGRVARGERGEHRRDMARQRGIPTQHATPEAVEVEVVQPAHPVRRADRLERPLRARRRGKREPEPGPQRDQPEPGSADGGEDMGHRRCDCPGGATVPLGEPVHCA